jgi:hypothetical protein
LIASHNSLRVYCGIGAWSPIREGIWTRNALRQRSASSLPRSLRTVGTILRRDADTTTRTSASREYCMREKQLGLYHRVGDAVLSIRYENVSAEVYIAHGPFLTERDDSL